MLTKRQPVRDAFSIADVGGLNNEAMKTFSTITFGCRVNSAQTQELEEKLRGRDWRQVEKAENPDIFIINSCCVTQKAEKEVKKMVRSVLRNFPCAEIYLTGCLTKLRGFEKFSNPRVKYELDFGQVRTMDSGQVLRPRVFDREVQIESAQDRGARMTKRAEMTDKDQNRQNLLGRNKEKPLNKFLRSDRAFVKIQEGCDNRCSYCVVPYVRGKLYSKPIKEVIAEIRKRSQEEIREIIITGTNLGKYKYGLANLFEEILKKTAMARISFGSINYEAINEDMEKFIRVCRSPRISKHLHVPVQSGSPKILKLMKRPYAVDSFQKMLGRLRKAIPDITFGTDIIVGFPGEEEADFRATVDFIKKNRFLRLHVFRFSLRPGTLASEKESLWGRMEETTKKSRAEKIRKMMAG